MKVVECARWQDFRAYVEKSYNPITPTYWRGQRDAAWPLASRFERQILSINGGCQESAQQIYPYNGRYLLADGKPPWETGFPQRLLRKRLVGFKDAASGLRGPNPAPLDEDQWWALGRHYGLITPLLDWSLSPYIAAFFALTDLFAHMTRHPSSALIFEGNVAAVYRLLHNESLEGDGLRILRPQVDELGRMQAQRGLFTWIDSDTYFELQGFVDNTGRGDCLTKVTISDQALIDGMRDLRDHGIDHRLLLPDLAGAAMQANLDLP